MAAVVLDLPNTVFSSSVWLVPLVGWKAVLWSLSGGDCLLYIILLSAGSLWSDMEMDLHTALALPFACKTPDGQ